MSCVDKDVTGSMPSAEKGSSRRATSMAEKDWIRRYFAPLAESAGAVGLTDDLAEFSAASRTVVTTDAIVEGVHFLSSNPIASIARKLVRVNVSDVLASGSLPSEALLVLGWPNTRHESELAEFAEAFGSELQAWGIALVGGDTVTSPAGLFLSLTLTGHPKRADVIRRSGAQLGDDIWVSGEIGWAGLGLKAALAGHETDSAIRYFQEPQLPPREIAACLAEHATASIDVSDGLLIDLKAILSSSGVGADLHLDDVPFPDQVNSLDAMLMAATAGDDYQILFTAPPQSRQKIGQCKLPLKTIGVIHADEKEMSVYLNGSIVNLPETLGFEHS